mgnify:FL=1
MSNQMKNLSLSAYETDALLHILWMRLALIYSEYKSDYHTDIEINTIKDIADRLGEPFKTVIDNGKWKVVPRHGSMPT